MTADLFLPGIDASRVLASLGAAGGDEVGSGKFASPESSAALAVNTFAWFLDQPHMLPPLPGLSDLDWPADQVEIERCLRFPWAGGRHPWLDAVVETPRHLIGIESKRFEPFRDLKQVSLSAAYDRPVWGAGMRPFEELRDALRSGLRYRHLDVAQLLKHAFGIATQAAAHSKAGVLYYLYAEPATRGAKPIAQADIRLHREEVDDFASRIAGASVRFAASDYRTYLGGFVGEASDHASRVLARFAP